MRTSLDCHDINCWIQYAFVVFTVERKIINQFMGSDLMIRVFMILMYFIDTV